MPFPHPQQLPGVASAALGLAGCTNSLAEFGGGSSDVSACSVREMLNGIEDLQTGKCRTV